MKRSFTKGKMNKDLDERLVPNGEYRDAMNVQVMTSEGSDVGTVQNVLGNVPGCVVDLTPNNSYTVGSVADEKNDTLYWLVSGNSGFAPEMKDMILRRKPDLVNSGYTCEPVFVPLDIHYNHHDHHFEAYKVTLCARAGARHVAID